MFRPLRLLLRPALSCLCSGGPLGSRLPFPPRRHREQRERSAFLCSPLPLTTQTGFSMCVPFKSPCHTLPPDTIHELPITNSLRINTCKNAAKQTTLTIFKINTYEKSGEGIGVLFLTKKRRRISVPNGLRELGISPPTRWKLTMAIISRIKMDRYSRIDDVLVVGA